VPLIHCYFAELVKLHLQLDVVKRSIRNLVTVGRDAFATITDSRRFKEIWYIAEPA